MSATAERWSLIVVASLMLAIDIGMFWSFGLAPWTLVPPVLVLAFVLFGPHPRLTRWRDGMLVLCLVLAIARVFVPREWPRELRWSFGTFGISGIGLAFVAYFQGDGLGARMRRLAETGFGRGLRLLFHRSSELFMLVAALGLLGYAFAQPGANRALIVIPAVLVTTALFPIRWKAVGQGVQILGCLPLPVLAIGGLMGWTKPGWFWLLLLSGWAADSVSKLRAPVPPSTLENEAAPSAV